MEGFNFAIKQYLHRLKKSSREMSEIVEGLEMGTIKPEDAAIQWMEVVSDTFNSTRRARGYVQRTVTVNNNKVAFRTAGSATNNGRTTIDI